MPLLGRKTVDAITTADVMAVLVPIWSTKRETARRVRQRIGAVMKWSVAHRYQQDNLAGDEIAEALPRDGTSAKTHHLVLPHAEVAGAVEKIRASGAYRATVLAFEFLVLTASRSGEVRGARWNEFEFESATWTVPAARMKMARPHRVPLSPRAIEILEEARELSDDADLVFTSPTGRMLSDSTISKLVRENGIGCVPHGMRSSFRDWAAECSVAPREVCQLAFAHVNNDCVEAAYRRRDLFEHRRELMAEWASYVETSVGTPPSKKSAPWAPLVEDRRMRSGVQGSLGLRSVRTDMPCHAQTLLNLETECLVESANFGVCAPNLKIDFCAAGSP